MKLRVLGSSAAYPRVHGTCSGYLVSDGRTRLLVDLGTGAMAQLLAYLDPWDLAGITVSHLHVDHYADLYPLYLFYRFAERKRELPRTVHAPTGLADILYTLDGGTENIDAVYRFVDHEEGAERLIDGLSVRLTGVPHAGKASFAMRISGASELVYSSDCEFSEQLVELAARADALLVEASAGGEAKALAGHMDARLAARVAREAGVRTLVLAHLWPTYTWERALAAAREEFDGPILAATDGLELNVTTGEAAA